MFFHLGAAALLAAFPSFERTRSKSLLVDPTRLKCACSSASVCVSGSSGGSERRIKLQRRNRSGGKSVEKTLLCVGDFSFSLCPSEIILAGDEVAIHINCSGTPWEYANDWVRD